MRTFKVTFEIDAAMLPCIADVLHDKRIVNLSMVEMQPPEPLRIVRKSKAAKKLNLESPPIKLILAYLRDNPGGAHYQYLGGLVTHAGMSPRSVSPLLSQLSKAGHIKRVGRGMYQIAS